MRKRWLYVGIGSFIITVVLFLTILLPAVDPRYSIFNIFQRSDESLAVASFPTNYFGYRKTDVSPTARTTEDKPVCGKFQMNNTNGKPDNITVFIRVTTAAKDTACAIYDASFVKVATCTVKNLPSTTYNWEKFTVNWTKNTSCLLANHYYYLAVWTVAGDGAAQTAYNASAGGLGVYTTSATHSDEWQWEDPATFDTTVDADGALMIYCNYSLYTQPSLASPSPANASVNIPLSSMTNITATTPHGYPLTITWFNNETGPWVNYGHNNSVGNGTYRQAESWASSGSTKYWWKVTVNDGATNRTYWYYFTTEVGDSTAPSVAINFAGNLSDSGGPYYRPPGESDILDEAGEGVWRDGYYTNNSYQHEDWMYINVTATDAESSVTNVWLNWLNNSVWTNLTYAFVHRGGYWDFNTSGIKTFDTSSYSFDIVANSSGGHSHTAWNKTNLDLGPTYVRRAVHLNCTGESIDYKPFYLYKAIYVVADNDKQDRLEKDQSTNGTINDTGMLRQDIPTDAMADVWCSSTTGLLFDDDICVIPGSIQNIYYHLWWSDNGDEMDTIGWNHTRGLWGATNPEDVFSSNVINSKSNITWAGGSPYDTYHLAANYTDIADWSFTDNNITEFLIRMTDKGFSYAANICNISVQTFLLFNVPSNATLNASYVDSDDDGMHDWDELYRNGTNPFIADTDNDGQSDYDEVTYGSDPNNYTSQYVITAAWQIISSNINGSFWNGTAWYQESSSINGSFWNQTTWSVVSDAVNGSFYNATGWMVVSNTINGSFFNSTQWQAVSSTLNGSFFNTTYWAVLSSTINGSFYNDTGWAVVSDLVNGSFYNTTRWLVVTDTINGSFFNSSFIGWHVIDGSINGSFYNTTEWIKIIDTINGSFYNITTWDILSSSINGSFYNSTMWITVDDTINGSFYNISSASWQIITDMINGSFFNISIGVWNIVSDIINGSFYNETFWSVESDVINGSFYNITPAGISIYVVYPMNMSSGVLRNVTYSIQVNHSSGLQMTITWYRDNGSVYLGSHVNVGNGTYYMFSGADLGDHRYNWSVNVSDVVSWENSSQWYVTGLGGGSMMIRMGSRSLTTGMIMGGVFVVMMVVPLVLLFVRKRRQDDDGNET